MGDGFDIEGLAKMAALASRSIASSTERERNEALSCMARALRDESDAILAANSEDVSAAKCAGTKDSLIDRLALDEARIEEAATALESLVALPDPLGRVLEERTLYNGIHLEKVSVPLGVVGIIYEARPNVTVDAVGICIKSGNACILRGGSLAARSNGVISDVLSRAASDAGFPQGCITAITATDRRATDELLSLHGLVDVIIPRGGAGLIKHCVEASKVPVIETGTGNCHVYVHESADLTKAYDIVLNAKCRRYGVCNAAETLLLDESINSEFLELVAPAFAERGVLMHCDPRSFEMLGNINVPENFYTKASEEDWETEYLGPEIAIRCVAGVHDAIEHINRYGTKHSEAIVAEDGSAIEEFLNGVDASSVYANASTAFTDGGQFGLGAEIGISTQKLHVRGPFALEALTSYKYVLRGNGQVRD